MMDGNNLLIIAPEVVPRIKSWGGSQRMYYLANMLEKQGKNVITVSPGFGLASECRNREVLYHPFYLGGNMADEENDVAKNRNEGKRKRILRIFFPFKEVKKLVYILLVMVDYFVYSEPSSFQGRFYKKWLEKYREDIWECIHKNGIEKVIISGPSFSLFGVAKQIKERNESIQIIFDYRDPWHLWKGRKNWAYGKEKRYLKYADRIVCCSDAFREDMCRKFGIDRKKTEVVYNGYSEEAWERVEESFQNDKGEEERKKRKDEKQLIISYVGSMDFNDNRKNYRNPNIAMQAVEERAEGSVELRFVGVDTAEGMKKRRNIKYIGKVTQEEAFIYMLQSDVLLNIHDVEDASGKYLVPGKYYDYMRSGKVIWNIGKEEGLAAKLLREYKLGVSCENCPEDVRKILDGLIERKRQGKIESLRTDGKEGIKKYSREKQNKKYIGILGNF